MVGSEPDLDDFRRYRSSGARDLRNRLVEAQRSLVEPYVQRYSGKGIPAEDLRQHALLALVHAVERFDPDRGVSFATFGGRTVDGELKRLLRDRAWAVRPPRRTQELALRLRRSEDDLTARLGRPPTIRELAVELGVDVDDVLTAREAAGARRSTGLETPLAPGGSGSSPGETLATTDPGFEQVENALVVRDLLDGLPERERTVLQLRFGERLGQPEIAERLGLSQSYVSRLVRRTLQNLQEHLTEADTP